MNWTRNRATFDGCECTLPRLYSSPPATSLRDGTLLELRLAASGTPSLRSTGICLLDAMRQSASISNQLRGGLVRKEGTSVSDALLRLCPILSATDHSEDRLTARETAPSAGPRPALGPTKVRISIMSQRSDRGSRSNGREVQEENGRLPLLSCEFFKPSQSSDDGTKESPAIDVSEACHEPRYARSMTLAVA